MTDDEIRFSNCRDSRTRTRCSSIQPNCKKHKLILVLWLSRYVRKRTRIQQRNWRESRIWTKAKEADTEIRLSNCRDSRTRTRSSFISSNCENADSVSNSTKLKRSWETWVQRVAGTPRGDSPVPAKAKLRCEGDKQYEREWDEWLVWSVGSVL